MSPPIVLLSEPFPLNTRESSSQPSEPCGCKICHFYNERTDVAKTLFLAGFICPVLWLCNGFLAMYGIYLSLKFHHTLGANSTHQSTRKSFHTRAAYAICALAIYGLLAAAYSVAFRGPSEEVDLEVSIWR